MRLIVTLIVICHAVCMAQSPKGKAETVGPCSPAVNGNHNTIKMDCNPIASPINPYDISGKRGELFQALLNTQVETRDSLIIGCIAWMPESCVAAGKFLLLFSQAGWKIIDNRVFRMDTSIPPEGVTLASKAPKYTDNLPPHLGHWNAMDTSQVTLWDAFIWMQVPMSATGDPDMAVGTTGIYFGAIPKNETVRTHAESKKLLSQLVEAALIKFKVIGRTCPDDVIKCKLLSLQEANFISVLLDNCDCGIGPSWPKDWNAIDTTTNSADDPATLISRRSHLLQKFAISLDKAK